MQGTQLAKRLNESKPEDNPDPKISNSDVALAYIELLCQGKNDFDHIREMNNDPDFYISVTDSGGRKMRNFEEFFIKFAD